VILGVVQVTNRSRTPLDASYRVVLAILQASPELGISGNGSVSDAATHRRVGPAILLHQGPLRAAGRCGRSRRAWPAVGRLS